MGELFISTLVMKQWGKVLFKAFQKGSHESRLKASPRKLKEFLVYLAQRWGKIVSLHAIR